LERRKKRQVRIAAWQSSAFRRYFPAAVCSTLGASMQTFLWAWNAWDLTHSASWVGTVVALMLAPAILLSLPFGILSDRVNPRYGLVTSTALYGGVAMVAGLTIVFDQFELPVLLVLATTHGAINAGHGPMRLALVPLLVDREALPHAVGLSAMTFHSARILGPAVAAWLLAQTDQVAVFGLSALCFITASMILASLQGVGVRPPRERQPFFQQLRTGLQYAVGHELLRNVFWLTALNGILGRTVIELLPALSGERLAGGSSELASLVAIAAAGSILGGLITSRQSTGIARLLVLAGVSLLVAASAQLALHWADQLASLALLCFFVSGVTTIAGTACQTIIQLSVQETFRGRVMSLWMLTIMGAPALSALAVGHLADRVGFVPVLLITGVLGLLLTAVFYRRARRALPD